MSWDRILYRVLSGALLLAAGAGLYLLVPGSNMAGLERAAVVSPVRMKLDRNVYLFDEGGFRRAGVLVRSYDGTDHALELLDGVLDCDCLVATLARPSVRQFLRMQAPEDWAVMRQEVSDAIFEGVGDLFRLMQSYDDTDDAGEALSQALARALENPDAAAAQSAIATNLKGHFGPELPAAVGGIFVSRVTDAVKVVVADASENYGLDLVRGDFDTGPINVAVDGLLGDPRLVEIVSKTAASIVSDPVIVEAARVFAAEYGERLFDALISAGELPTPENGDGTDEGVSAEEVVGKTMAWVEAQVYRDEVAHPVILAMAHNVLLPKTPRSDAILVLMTPAAAAAWFVADDILPLAGSWEMADDQG